MKRTLKQYSDIILETIDSIVILMNLDGIVVAMNKAAENITGYDAKDIVNKKHWSIFIPQDEQAKVDEIFHALIHGKKVATSFNHCISKTNELIDIKWNSSFIRDENDEIQFIVVTGTNLSTYKLDIEEQRLSSFVFETTDPCVISDKDNRIIRVNKAFTDVTGYSKDEVINKNPNLLSSGLHDKTFYRLMWESIEETGSWFGEVINRKKDGSLFTEYLKIIAVYDDYGDISLECQQFFVPRF